MLLLWLDEIVIPECVTYNEPDWDIEPEDLEDYASSITIPSPKEPTVKTSFSVFYADYKANNSRWIWFWCGNRRENGEKMDRKLATVRRIKDIHPIPEADKIELAIVRNCSIRLFWLSIFKF